MNRRTPSTADDHGWVPMTQTRLVKMASGSYLECQPVEPASQDTCEGSTKGGGRYQLSGNEAGAVQNKMFPPDQRRASCERGDLIQERPQDKPSKKPRNFDYTVLAPLGTEGGGCHNTKVPRTCIPRTVNEAIDRASIRTLFPQANKLSEQKIEEQIETCKRYRDKAYETGQQPRKENIQAAEEPSQLQDSNITLIERDAQAAENRQNKTTPDGGK